MCFVVGGGGGGCGGGGVDFLAASMLAKSQAAKAYGGASREITSIA